MTLQMMEGYDWLPDTTDIGQNYPQLNAMGWTGDFNTKETSGTAFGYGKAMLFAPYSSAFHSLNRPLPKRYSNTIFVGRRMYFGSGVDTWAFGFADSLNANALQMYLRPNPYGGFSMYNAGGTLIGATRSNVFQYNKFFYMEMKYKCHPTNGVFEMRINTVPVLSVTNFNTSAGTPVLGNPFGVDMLYMQYQTFGGGVYIEDDLYVTDDTGSINNGYLGNIRVPCQLVSGNSSPLQFTIGGSSPAATNWQSVQNLNLDDTKFVYTPTAGHRDSYTVNPSINSPTIYGAQLSIAYKQDDATQRVVRNVIDSGGTLAEGDDHYINQSYTFYSDVYELNPNTGGAWTSATLNALKVGPKVVT